MSICSRMALTMEGPATDIVPWDGMRVAWNALAALAVIIGLPWLIGLSFLDALVILPFSCLSTFFAPGLVVKWGGSMSRAAGTAWVAGLAFLAASLAVLNWMHWHGTWLLPAGSVLGAAAVLSLAACRLAAAVCKRILPGADSPEAAQRSIRRWLMVIMGMALWGHQLVPSSWTAPLEADLSTGGIVRKAWILAGALLAGAALLVRQWSPTPPSENT